MSDFVPGLDDDDNAGDVVRTAENVLAVQALAESKRGANGWDRANCPFCVVVLGKVDKSWAWGHNPETSRWKCFRCKTWGYFKAGGGRDYTPAVIESAGSVGKVTGGAAGVDALPLTEAQQWPEGFEYVGTFKPNDDPFDERNDVIDYLKKRGITCKLARSVHMGMCVTGKYHHRVIVPVLDPTTQALVGFIARSIERKPYLKYLYPKEMPRGRVMFNQAALTADTVSPVIVVEGIFDALPYWPHAVACLGKPSDTHVEMLAACKRPLVIALDGDAWEEGQWLAERLTFDGTFAVSIKLPPGEDPGSVTREWLRQAAQHAIQEKRQSSCQT